MINAVTPKLDSIYILIRQQEFYYSLHTHSLQWTSS